MDGKRGPLYLKTSDILEGVDDVMIMNAMPRHQVMEHWSWVEFKLFLPKTDVRINMGRQQRFVVVAYRKPPYCQQVRRIKQN